MFFFINLRYVYPIIEDNHVDLIAYRLAIYDDGNPTFTNRLNAIIPSQRSREIPPGAKFEEKPSDIYELLSAVL